MPIEKIAILGAGVGSMTAAFEITSQPNWQDKYDITIYQLGWRAGGKGASGRNHQIADRIQEHGLHVWMGFYENAFEMIRQAYEYCAQNNLTPGTPFPSYRDAFTKMSFDPVTEQVNEVWKIWPIFWSPNDDIPGQANPTDAAPPVDGTLWGYIRAIVDTVRGHLDRLIDGEPLLQGIIDNLVDDIREAAEGNDGGGHDTLLHRIASFVHSLPIDSAAHTDEQHNLLLAAIVRLVELVFHHLESLAEENDEIRRFLIVADTAFGFVHGIIADDIMENGFAAIEKEDFVDWLARNNCRSAKSALTRGMYDGAFAYEDGDRTKPRASAGSILHGSLRLMFTYRGSFMWFMNAGMGDVVFTPLYKALRHRGVKFEFFRKVTRLAPSPDGAVDSIEMNIQAHVRPELAEYDPLVPVKGLLCWPAEPRYEQLVEASILQDPKFVNRDLESWWTDLPTFGSVSLKRGV